MSIPSPDDPTLPGSTAPVDDALEETIRREPGVAEATPLPPPPACSDATMAVLSQLPGPAPAPVPAPPAVVARTPRHPTPAGILPVAAALRYQRREVLGRGGMGMVWAALDPGLGREVAIKTMLQPGQAQDLGRFVEEAQVTGQLEHPNIVPVHELGMDPEKGPYLVMKRVRGRSLKDVLRDVADGKSGSWRPDSRVERSGMTHAAEPESEPGVYRTAAFHTQPGSDRRDPVAGDAGAGTIRSLPGAAESASAPVAAPAAGAVSAEPVEKALPWLLNAFVKVCEAVAYAHSRGVIHRDLKPDNVMVGEFGEVVVMDWGLAKVLGRPETKRERLLVTERTANPDGVARTMDGEVIGTPMYMPPEQASGKVEELDERSDVYSLGAILYEILALERPFDVENVYALLQKVGDGQFLPPSRRSKARWDVPRELEAVALKAMSHAPQARYPSATALKEDVEAWFAGRRLSAVEYSSWELAVKFASRHRGTVLTGVAALLVLVLSTAIFVYNVTRARAEAERMRDRAEQERAKAREAEGEARRQEHVAQVQLAGGMVLQADALLGARRWNEAVARYEEARGLFERIGAPSPAPDLGLMEAWRMNPPALLVIDGFRGPTSALAMAPDGRRFLAGGGQDPPTLFDLRTGRRERVLEGAAPDAVRAAWSRDGARVVVAHADGRLSAWDPVAARLQWTSEPIQGGVHTIAFAPDGGSFLAMAKDSRVMIRDAGSGALLRATRISGWDACAGALSPDGKWVFCGGTDDVVHWLDAATLKEEYSVRGSGGYVFGAAWSPDGRRTVTCVGSGPLDVWDALTRKRQHVLSGHGQYVWRVALAFDSRRALSAGGDGTLRLWDIAVGAEMRTLYGHAESVSDCVFTPDGARAVSTSGDGTVRVWDLASNPERAELLGHLLSVGRVAVSRDGRRAISNSLNDGTARVWDLDGLRLLVTLRHRSAVREAEFCPDGRRAVTVADDGVMRLWDLVERKEIAAFSGHQGMAMCVAVSPDGKRALTGDQMGWVRLWDLESRRELLSVPAHKKWIGEVLFLPDGRRAVSVSSDGSARLLDLETAAELATYGGHTGMVVHAGLSPDFRLLATASADHVARIFETETGTLVRELRGHTGPVGCVRFTLDGRQLITAASDGALWRWDVETGKELQAFGSVSQGQTHGFAAFTPDGRMVVTGPGTAISVRDFGRPARHREMLPRLAAARERLDRDPADAGALAELGAWYLFRGAWDWAADLLEAARAGGAAVNPLDLARALAQVGRFEAARREVDAVREERGGADADLDLHLTLVSAALEDARRDSEQSRSLLARAGPVEPGSVEVRLDERSPLDGGRRIAVHRVLAFRGSTMSLRLASTDFRPFLLVFGPPTGQLLATQGGEGKDASYDLAVPEDGEYVLLCTSAEPGKTGKATLDIDVRWK